VSRVKAAPDADPDDVAAYLAEVRRSRRTPAGRPDAGLVQLSAVTSRRLRWLWPGRIPAGMLTMLDGDPGVGKSTLALDFAARLTTGGPWPDGAKCTAANVMLLTAEDALAETVRPRVEIAGGDARRVYVLTHIPTGEAGGARLPALPGDVLHIGALVKDYRIRLLILDVLDSYLGGGDSKVNSHRNSDIRQALYPLAVMAQQRGVAVLALRHLNKATSLANPMYRGIGSIGITGQSRAVHLAALDPDDAAGERRIFCPVKINVGPLPPSLSYTLMPGFDGDHATVKWLGEDQHTAAQLLAAQLEEAERTDRDEAARWVQSYLFHADGSAPYSDILAASRKHGIAERTLKRTKDRAGVTFRRAGWQKGTVWVLSPEVMAALAAEEAEAEDASGPSGPVS
jgi:hypothetical protein